jgi:predicted RNA-binding protein YlxR (DUF448 family)
VPSIDSTEVGSDDGPVLWDERPPGRADRVRTSIVGRVPMPVEELVRFVLAPDGTVVPDLKRRLPGRGVWVEATRAAVDTAVAKKLFARAFRTGVTVDPDLGGLVDRLSTERALGHLGLACKAGLVVTGFTKVEQAVAHRSLTALVRAAEAGEDGAAKMTAALRRRFGEEIGCPVVRIFSGAQLDLALGRSNVIHAALLAGRASESFLERALALGRYRGITAVDAGGQRVTRGTPPQE